MAAAVSGGGVVAVPFAHGEIRRHSWKERERVVCDWPPKPPTKRRVIQRQSDTAGDTWPTCRSRRTNQRLMEEESAELVGGIMMKAAIGDLSISRITGTHFYLVPFSFFLELDRVNCILYASPTELQS